MKVDFADAARRHYADAELLWREQRRPNASQLCGLAAECALKAVMVALGMPLKPGGAPPGRYKVHIDKLWELFPTFAQGRSASRYAALLCCDDNPFGDWSVEQRYWSTQAADEPAQLRRHLQGAKRAMTLLRRAQQDGLL